MAKWRQCKEEQLSDDGGLGFFRHFCLSITLVIIPGALFFNFTLGRETSMISLSAAAHKLKLNVFYQSAQSLFCCSHSTGIRVALGTSEELAEGYYGMIWAARYLQHYLTASIWRTGFSFAKYVKISKMVYIQSLNTQECILQVSAFCHEQDLLFANLYFSTEPQDCNLNKNVP